MKKYIFTLFGLAIMVFALSPFIFKHISDITKSSPIPPSTKPVYEDKENLLYLMDKKLVYINKESKNRQWLELSTADFEASQNIINKTANAPPLIGLNIEKGIKLINNKEIHVIGLEPKMKLISSYPNPQCKNDKIIVDKSENLLYLYENGDLVKTYRVSTGKEHQYTPEGTFKIINKEDYPRGKDPDSQLGACWMGLSVPPERDKRAVQFDERAPQGNKYGIHGTNEPDSIGTHASGGCIRMHNNEVTEICQRIKIGTVVEIRP